MLSHGFAGSARNFRPQARFLRDRHRVVLFDARGHARSAAPIDPDEYTPDAFVSDMQRMVERARAASVVIVGVSMGAAIALRYALRYPDTITGLVLASYPSAGSASSWALSLADALDREGAEVAGERFVWGGGRFDAASAKLIRQGFLEHRPEALSLVLRRFLAIEPAPAERKKDLAALRVPTLLVAGERDVPSVESTRALAALLPVATHVVVPDAGHVLNLEKPESFNEALSHFLSGIEAPK